MFYSMLVMELLILLFLIAVGVGIYKSFMWCVSKCTDTTPTYAEGYNVSRRKRGEWIG